MHKPFFNFLRPSWATVLLSVAVTIFLTACRSKPVLMEVVPSSASGIKFSNILPDREGLNILYHINYYNGGGVSAADFNNDGLTDIFFTANSKGNNKLYINKGDFVFEDITTKAGVAGTADWCSGSTVADVNADGLLDIYVTVLSGKLGLQGHNELFINNGNNTFTESSAKYGLNVAAYGQQSVFFDYDRDGDLDCYVLNQSEKPFTYIVDTSYRHRYDSLAGDRLFRNDCNTPAAKFIDVSSAAGIWQSKLGFGLGLGVADINNDGWDDIYVSNDFHENDYYYLNNGNGTFTDAGAQHFRHFSRFSMGNDIADYNNDGQMDVVTVDMLPPDEKTLKTYGSDEQFDIYRHKITTNGFLPQYSRNCLQRNNGNGISFSEVSMISGVSATDWSWSPLFTDLNNDGIKDLIITSGIPKRPVDLDYVRFISNTYVSKQLNNSSTLDKEALEKIPDGASHTFIYQGNENGLFTDKSEEWGTAEQKGYFNGAAWADFDNDGDVDLVINSINREAIVYRNSIKEKKWLTIKFEGDSLNKIGIGVKAWVFSGNKMQYQQMMLTRGFQSSSEPRMHFGLDTTMRIDGVLVVWPDQKFQVISGITPGKQLVVKYSDALGKFNYDGFFKPKKEMLQDISSQFGINWKHRENDFIDFNSQYLIPHELSSRGPKIATADVNKDGLEDFYICGSRNQGGCLMLQTKQGKFSQSDTALFNQYLSFEDADAVFFDANNDTWPDLYIASGGNEYEDGSANLADRFFLNDGKGYLIAAQNIPQVKTNKSCVAVADVDKDGDMDIFVGGLANSKTYGVPQSSSLLVNDGKGNFSLAGDNMINLHEIGMITSSVFTDLNKDGWTDLVVAGEWMPVKIFMNEKGIFKAKDLPQSTGLWQTLYATDVNGDGFTDVLAGNWGHNSKLYAGKNGPLKLYVKDFDKNGAVEQILAYTINGKEYPFLPKDELEKSLPTLKKGYVTYSEVAGKTVDYILYNLFVDYSELKAETLSSSCFLNDGKGNFKMMALPDELQLAPVMAFTSYNERPDAFMAAGNFYGVLPYEGRYDALLPTAYFFDAKNSGFHRLTNLPALSGEVRDMKWINYANEKILLFARNNDSLKFYKLHPSIRPGID